MAAKGVIKEVVNWSSSRFFFYKRLRRRVEEGWMVKAAQNAAGKEKQGIWIKLGLQLLDLLAIIGKMMNHFMPKKSDPNNDEERLKELRLQKVIHQVRKLGESPLGMQALLQV